jgi:hypothetical protein
VYHSHTRTKQEDILFFGFVGGVPIYIYIYRERDSEPKGNKHIHIYIYIQGVSRL